jgi:hypothetical protein
LVGGTARAPQAFIAPNDNSKAGRDVGLADQMSQGNLTGLFGCDKRLERRADNLHRSSILINRTPGSHESRTALEPGTAAALVTDHERKAAATRIPNLNVFDRSNDAIKMHDTPTKKAPRSQPSH